MIVGQVVSEDTLDSYLRSDGPLVASLGLKDLIVIATDEVVLVAAKDRAQDVRIFARRLGAAEPKDP